MDDHWGDQEVDEEVDEGDCDMATRGNGATRGRRK
jgi:hypothetical protein